MITVLFFSRCELTDFYALLSRNLENEFNIIHVAYSSNERNILNQKYNIKADYVFSEMLKTKLDDSVDEDILNEIDLLIVKESNGRFTLNSSMQSDRGFTLLNYDEALLLAQSQYKIWLEIFSSNKIDFFYHEPPSLFMNHIASFLALSHNAKYCYDSMIKGEDLYNYIILVQDTAVSPELNLQMSRLNEEEIEKNSERIKKFISEFRQSYNVYFGEMMPNKIKYFYLIKQSFKIYIKQSIYKKKYNKLKDNIDYYLLHQNEYWNKLKNIINYKLNVDFDDLDISCKYYYYSMNLEPESTVLYLGDGIYENQVKLIMNIASQLPPNTYLYVKDHPHFIGYRNHQDYVKLKSVPNIKVLKAEIPGKKVILHCIGVFMINGTAGFEAILLNKQIYTFGNMFFNISERVNYIKNIKDLQRLIYNNKNLVYKDDYNLYKFVLSFLNSTHQGVTDFFQGRMESYPIDQEKNIDTISKDLSNFFRIYNNLKVNTIEK